MSAGKHAGVVKLRIDGIDYGTKPGLEVDLGDDEHTEVISSGEFAGTFATPKAASISGSIDFKRAQDYEVLRKMEGGKIEVEYDNGFMYSITEAQHRTSPKLRDGGQGIQIDILGKKATQVQAG